MAWGALFVILAYFDQACTQLVACSVDGVEQTGGTNVWASDTELFNGTTGQTRQKQLWLKNDVATETYTGVSVSAVGEDTARDLQFAPDVGGSPGAWDETLALADGDYTLPVPFWVRCILAAGTTAAILTGADIKITGSKIPREAS